MKFNLSIVSLALVAAVIAAPVDVVAREKEGFAYKRVAEKEGFAVCEDQVRSQSIH